MSVLKHEWMIIFEAEKSHDIESLCIDVGIASFNTVKIVALKNMKMYRIKYRNKGTNTFIITRTILLFFDLVKKNYELDQILFPRRINYLECFFTLDF